jgi:hypothetical protein
MRGRAGDTFFRARIRQGATIGGGRDLRSRATVRGAPRGSAHGGRLEAPLLIQLLPELPHLVGECLGLAQLADQ